MLKGADMANETKPLDEIFDRKSEPQTDREPAATPEPSESTADDAGQPRDDQGRFANKQPAESAPVEQPTGEQPAVPPAVKSVEASVPPGHIPISAFVDMRLEAREAKRRADDFQRQLVELQKAKEQPPVDFFQDPDAALAQRLTPFEQRLDAVTQRLTLRASKAEAIAIHGKEAVAKMEQAIGEAMEAGDPEVVQQLRSQLIASDDPVGLAMSWHQRRSVMSEVGTDPVAYREKLRAEILAEIQANGGKPAANGAAGAPVMPSNLAGTRNVGTRSGPAWAGPIPLDDIFKR
jgi:hypothetical protein